MSIGTTVNPETDDAPVTHDGHPHPDAEAAGSSGASGSSAPAPEGASGDGADEAGPLLRVTKGSPRPDELAALVAVVAAAAGNGGDGPAGPEDRWGDYGEALDGARRVFAPRAFQSGGFGGR